MELMINGETYKGNIDLVEVGSCQRRGAEIKLYKYKASVLSGDKTIEKVFTTFQECQAFIIKFNKGLKK